MFKKYSNFKGEKLEKAYELFKMVVLLNTMCELLNNAVDKLELLIRRTLKIARRPSDIKTLKDYLEIIEYAKLTPPIPVKLKAFAQEEKVEEETSQAQDVQSVLWGGQDVGVKVMTLSDIKEKGMNIDDAIAEKPKTKRAVSVPYVPHLKKKLNVALIKSEKVPQRAECHYDAKKGQVVNTDGDLTHTQSLPSIKMGSSENTGQLPDNSKQVKKQCVAHLRGWRCQWEKKCGVAMKRFAEQALFRQDNMAGLRLTSVSKKPVSTDDEDTTYQTYQREVRVTSDSPQKNAQWRITEYDTSGMVTGGLDESAEKQSTLPDADPVSSKSKSGNQPVPTEQMDDDEENKWEKTKKPPSCFSGLFKKKSPKSPEPKTEEGKSKKIHKKRKHSKNRNKGLGKQALSKEAVMSEHKI